MQWLFVPFFESPRRSKTKTTLRMQKVSRKKTVSGSLGRGSSDRPLTVDFSHVEARFSCFLRVLQEARAFGLYCCNDKPLLYAKIFSFFFFANLDIYNTFLDEKKVTFFDVARTSLGECCGGKMPQAKTEPKARGHA